MTERRPIRIGVHIQDAATEAEAREKCRLTPAYHQLLFVYPAATWDRRFDKVTQDRWNPRAWMVEFIVQRKG